MTVNSLESPFYLHSYFRSINHLTKAYSQGHSFTISFIPELETDHSKSSIAHRSNCWHRMLSNNPVPFLLVADLKESKEESKNDETNSFIQNSFNDKVIDLHHGFSLLWVV